MGVVVLLILNFVVITKGAGRVADVATRFAPDTTPGKQMAFDSDLNTGATHEEEARKRRSDVVQEADFFGSVDGTSKVVRGDAVVGILILLIGGLAVDIFQHVLDFDTATQTYATLAVGDGLVAQVTALIVSTAAGIVARRVSTDQNFAAQLGAQLAEGGKSFYLAGGILFLLGLIPGVLYTAFLGFGLLLGVLGWGVSQRKVLADESAAAALAKPAAPTSELDWNDAPMIELLYLELPYRLISLVDAGDEGDLIERIRAIRKKFVSEVRFLIPSVLIRDNLQLPAEGYRFLLCGAEVASGHALHDRLLTIEALGHHVPVRALRCAARPYGTPALWITRERLAAAKVAGFTAVKPAVVITSRLDQLTTQYARKLLGRQETHELTHYFKARFPKLVGETHSETAAAGPVAAGDAADRGRCDGARPAHGAGDYGRTTGPQCGAGGYRCAPAPPDRAGRVWRFQQILRGRGAALFQSPDGPNRGGSRRGSRQCAGARPDEPPSRRSRCRGGRAGNPGPRPCAGVLVCGLRSRLTLSRLLRRVRPQAAVPAMAELPPTAKLQFLRVICQR